MGDVGDTQPGTQPERHAGRRSQVYLLRLWRDEPGVPWRLSVRPADREAAIGLADLDELVVFLLREMARDAADRRAGNE